MNATLRKSIVLLMTHWKIKVGEIEESGITGRFSLGKCEQQLNNPTQKMERYNSVSQDTSRCKLWNRL